MPHVHCHVIPRVRGDESGDAVYGMLQGEEGNVGGGTGTEKRKGGEVQEGDRFRRESSPGSRMRIGSRGRRGR